MHTPIVASRRPGDSRSAAAVIEHCLLKVAGDLSGTGATAFLNRVVSARCNREGQGNSRPSLTLVGGYAGSGKSEFSRFLAEVTGWALLDKDAMTCVIAEQLLASLGGDPHDRHTELYLRKVRPLEYRCLLDTAFDNLRVGTSAILSAPFVVELADADWMRRLIDQCTAMGVEVDIIWMHCDIASMRKHVELRRAGRDAWKLDNWATYTDGLDADNSPPAAHVIVDNRLGAAISVVDQTRDSLRRMLA